MLRFSLRRMGSGAAAASRPRLVYAAPPTTPEEVIAPVLRLQRGNAVPADLPSSALMMGGTVGFLATYFMILNWFYEGFVDLWDGTYGLEDDEDDD